MKPISQIFAIVLEQLPGYTPKPPSYYSNLEGQLLLQYAGSEKKAKEKLREYREKEACALLFGPQLVAYRSMLGGSLTTATGRKKPVVELELEFLNCVELII